MSVTKNVKVVIDSIDKPLKTSVIDLIMKMPTKGTYD
jgi:hypothetical protein